MGLLDKLFGTATTVTPQHLQTAAEFDSEVIGSEQPVILNVWSPTCAPCKRLAPVLVEVATNHADEVKVVEVSTMSDRGLLQRLGVRSTPTTIIYARGEEIGRVVGFRPRGWFDEMIAAELSSAA